MTAFGADSARAAAAVVRSRNAVQPSVGLILGSGLGGVADVISEAVRIPYRDVPGFPASTVAGHAGVLIVGQLDGVPVAALSGRFHMYEGHDAALTAFPVRLLHALGASVLIVSNAAASVRESVPPGTMVMLADHINLMFRNPLIGAPQPGDVRFPDMSEPYDADLRATARAVALEQAITLGEGVYAGLLGPSYETPAEVRMLARLGADLIGMSTVPEVIVARALGVRVLGISCVTNLACGVGSGPITHADVLETTSRTAGQLQRLVLGVVARLRNQRLGGGGGSAETRDLNVS